MSEVGLSQRAFAARARVTQQAVNRALHRGLLDRAADGKLDPSGPRSQAWIASHADPVVAPVVATSTADALLAEATASLRSREYDITLWRANTVNRAELAAKLHSEADKWLAICRRMPADAGADIAALMGVPADRLVPHLEQAITDFLSRRDPHGDIEKALAKAATDWWRHSVRTMHNPPPRPAFTPPATLADARRRYAEARAELAELKDRVRACELLCAWPARFSAGDWRVRLRQGATDELAAGHAALLLAAADFAVGRNSLEWALWMFLWDWFAWRLVALWPAPGFVTRPGDQPIVEARKVFEAERSSREAKD